MAEFPPSRLTEWNVLGLLDRIKTVLYEKRSTRLRPATQEAGIRSPRSGLILEDTTCPPLSSPEPFPRES